MTKTAQHLNTLSNAVDRNRRHVVDDVEDAELEAKFQQIEDEWVARREEMLRTREEVTAREKQRLER